MTKKYCDYVECMMQNHEHHHHDEHTITFRQEELAKSINLISISCNLMDGRRYLSFSMENGIFNCEVVPQGSPFVTVEISKDDTESLRKFLNEMKNYEDRKDELDSR
jgi:hypothetical protein